MKVFILTVLDATWNKGPLTTVERYSLKAAGPLLGLVPARRLPRLMADVSAVTRAARADLFRAFFQPVQERVPGGVAGHDRVRRSRAEYRTPVPLLLMGGERDRTGNIATAMPRWAEAEGVREIVVPGAGMS